VFLLAMLSSTLLVSILSCLIVCEVKSSVFGFVMWKT